MVNLTGDTETGAGFGNCLKVSLIGWNSRANSSSIQSGVPILLAEFEKSSGTHNGARWSELALTPGSHLGPFNDLQIYHVSLGELASSSWGRYHGLLSASDRSLPWPCALGWQGMLSVLTGGLKFRDL